MVKGTSGTTKWPLCCVVALLSAGCAMTPDWAPRKRATAQCPKDYLHYCTHSNSGTRCGCMPRQEMEAILRNRQ